MKNLMVKLLVLFLVSFCFFGCSKKPSISDLDVKDGLYYIKGTTNLYSGKIESKYSSGKDSIVGSVKDGKFDGVVISYYQNGKIKDSVDYKMGERKISKSYTEDGNPVCDCNEIYYNDSKDVWMVTNGEKVFDGMCISCWDNKNKKSSMVIKHGKLRENREWYENGNEKESWIYNEEGNFKSVSIGYKNGKPKQKISYEDGKYSSFDYWYENGYEKQKWTFDKGKLIKIELGYENGKKSIIIQYIFDGSNNQSDKVMQDGDVTSSYSKSNLVKSIDGWYEDGKLAFQIESKSEKPMYFDGNFQDWMNNPKEFLLNFKYIKNGKGKVYYQNGEWMTELFYEDEIKVRQKENIDGFFMWDLITSVRSVTKNKNSNIGSSDEFYHPFIEEINFYQNYGNQNIYIFDKVTTLEDGLLSYSKIKDGIRYPKDYRLDRGQRFIYIVK